jgi:AhpD family alkylhydroperoxidase
VSRMKAAKVEETTGKVKRILESFIANWGKAPNVYETMAHSPILLQATVTLDRLIGEGKLTGVEQVAAKLVASQHYGCEYCLGACTAVGASRGLSAQQMMDIRRGGVEDGKLAALVQFTRRMLETKGFVEDGDIESFRAGGYTDEHMLEVAAIIGAITLGSYFNNMNHTDLDFPKAPDI